MEPSNHPIEKENHLPNHHFQVPAANLPGCTSRFSSEWSGQGCDGLFLGSGLFGAHLKPELCLCQAFLF